MAAVQQTSSNAVVSGGGKKTNFIESMEEEVRKCAEHLERRQNWKSYRSTIGRKANGFSLGLPPSTSVATPSLQSSDSNVGSRNVSYRSILPRSCRSSAADQEGRIVLSPRILPPGIESPHKSPNKSSGNSIFRFSNGLEEVQSGQFLQLQEDHSPGSSSGGGGGGSYSRGNSAPPDALPCICSGSGASSRDNSLTPLQSPQGRTPIGAVASHSYFRKSSYSSSSPPPVPPKLDTTRSRCAKSQSPASLHCSHQVLHKMEVSSYHSRDPVDPLPPTELAAATNNKDNLKELQFPSADLDLQNFPEVVIKAKSALSICSSGLCGNEVESSVDKKCFRETLRVRSVSPGITSPTPAYSTPGILPPNNSTAEAKLRDVKYLSLGDMNLYGLEMKQTPHYPIVVKSEKEEKVLLKCVANNGPKLSVDVGNEEKQDVRLNQDEVNSKAYVVETTPSEALNIDQSRSVNTKCEKELEAHLKDQPPKVKGLGRVVDDQVTKGDKDEEKWDKGGDGNFKNPPESSQNREQDILEDMEERKVEGETKAGTELKPEISEEKTGFCTGAAAKEDSISIVSASSPVQQRSITMATETSGNTVSILSSLPSPLRSSSSLYIKQEMSAGIESKISMEPSNQRAEKREDFFPETNLILTDTYEPEVKSISIRSRSARQGGKHFKVRSGPLKHVQTSTQPDVRRASEPPIMTPLLSMKVASRPRMQSEPPRSGTKLQPLAVELEVPVGVSGSMQALVEDLQRQVKEREEELLCVCHQREQENKEKDECIKKLSREAKKVERTKWELLKRARDGAERSLHLRTQLDVNEGMLRSMQGELERTRDELVSVKSANTSLRALLANLRASRACSDVAVQVDLIGGSLQRNQGMMMAYTKELSQGHDSTLEQSVNFQSTDSLDCSEREGDREGYMDSISFTENTRDITPTPGQLIANSQALGCRESRKSRKKGTIFSKMIKSNRNRRGSRNNSGSIDGLASSYSNFLQGAEKSGSSLASSYQSLPSDLKEQCRSLESTKPMLFSKWDLRTTLTWMEIDLGLGQYSKAVMEKYPSGASMCTLTEGDMEKKLGISNPLHRRKLMLALLEKKAPQLCQYPHIGTIEHSWVAYEWAHDCGLAHLTETLITHLIDGRVLNSLTKDDLKRYLKISKKVDQLSFLSGVELLRMHDFNQEAIEQHRSNSHNALYWTNTDVCSWLRQINLEDYAGNVIGGGVHGALLFLERRRFNSDHLAHIIQIPNSKGQLRRHLAGKLASLFSEDISNSVDSFHHHSHSGLSGSPLNLSPRHHGSTSQSPLNPNGHSPLKGEVFNSPVHECTPSVRRNSLTRRSIQMVSRHNVISPPEYQHSGSPPRLQRIGSSPTVVRLSDSPHQFNRMPLNAGDRVRMSLRESSRCATHNEAPPCNRTVTPTILSSTTV